MKVSKNIYLHIQIAEILRGKSSSSALTISQLHESLKRKFGFQGTRKTITRNLHGMSNDFKLSSIGERPARYWIEDYFEPDFKIGLNPYQLQLITYSLRNLAQTATGALKTSLKNTEAVLISNLPQITKKELDHALKVHQDNRKAKPHPSWPKNNLKNLFLCARKNIPFRAKLKLPGLNEKQRHTMHLFLIEKLWFEEGELFLKVINLDTKKPIRVKGPNLNSVQPQF